MASSLETGRPSTAACSNGNDMELTFLGELRRVSVLMTVTRACCKEATLTSASTSEAAARKMTARQGKRKRKSPQLAAPSEVFRVRRKSASETTASKNAMKRPRENERRPGEAELRERKKKPAERIASRTI